MFCACLGILFCFAIIIAGSAISAIDIDKYDFGLYYIILAIVALTGSVTLCVIRPAKCCGISDPKWYTRSCEHVHQALLAAHERRLAEATTEFGIEAQSEAGAQRKNTISTTRQRATLLMLGPAVQMMHHVIYGQLAETSTGDDEEVEEDGPSLWWDVGYIEDQEEDKPTEKRKKKKKKRKKEIETQLCSIVKADIAVLSYPLVRPMATAEAVASQCGNEESADVDNQGDDAKRKIGFELPQTATKAQHSLYIV